MKVLLDTHAFLWSIMGNSALSEKAQKVFMDPANELYLSIASYWEICIKTALGKLVLVPQWRDRFDDEMRINSIHVLPMEKNHCVGIITLPDIHRDPFDRIIISQALCEGMHIMTIDPNIRKYRVPIVW